MQIETPLFEGQRICLGPIDYEKDPEIEARWTHDPSYVRMISTDLARPLSAAQVKKKYEAIEKKQDERRNQFYFTIRLRTDDRLIGKVHLGYVDWSNGGATLILGIGAAEDRSQGYGSEALGLILRYVFAELNLYRVSVDIPEYNLAALHVFQKAGFVQEVCRRQALARDGRRWDMLSLGLLADEWREREQAQ